MKRNIREIKKEAEFLVEQGEIEDFRFDHDRKHHLITFQFNGAWHSIPFAQSPRTAYGNNFVRQQIRRKIRGIESEQRI